MITKLFNYILEKSSLTRLGIPNEVMKDIQINFEIDSNANWEEIKYIKDIKEELKKDELAIFIEIKDDIKVILNDHKSYKEQRYKFDSSGWGSYNSGEIVDITYTQLLKGISSKSKIYKYLSNDIKTIPISKRKIQKKLKDFDNKTEEFKISIIKNFNNIVKKIYDKKYNEVMKKIAQNMSNVNPNLNPDDLLDFFKSNKKLAELAKEYELFKKNDDNLGLKRMEKQYNSLPIFDEFLINFEVEYSDKYNTRITISDLIDTFGFMQTQTSFLYFLYSGKIRDMKVSKFESFSQEYLDPTTYSDNSVSNDSICCSGCGKSIEIDYDKLQINRINHQPLCNDCIDKDEYPKQKNNWRWS